MFPLIYLQNCGSTQDELVNFLANQPVNTALYTFCQTGGRGQYGNKWESSRNMNLAYSIAVRCDHFQIPDSLFNFRTAIILRNFVANLTQTEVFIKWPNDLIIRNKKVSGMLIEKHKAGGAEFYIIGIGLNILQKDFTGLPKAGSILTQTAQEFDLKPTAEALHDAFVETLLNLQKPHEILSVYNSHLFRRNRVSTFVVESVRQNGIISHADEEGYLWVEMDNYGLRKFYHKEIELLY